MNGLFITLLVLLILGPSVKSKLRQLAATQDEDAFADASPSYAQDEDADEPFEPEQGNPYFSQETMGAPFDYEAMQAPAAQAPKPSHKKSSKHACSSQADSSAQPAMAQAVAEEADESSSSQQFDLRQAVICQTILNNEYLSDTRSYEN